MKACVEVEELPLTVQHLIQIDTRRGVLGWLACNPKERVCQQDQEAGSKYIQQSMLASKKEVDHKSSKRPTANQ